MFTFGFNVSETVQEPSGAEKTTQSSQINGSECVESVLPEEILQGITINSDQLHVFLANPSIQIEYLNCLVMPKDELPSDILVAEDNHSDLIAGQYEGGLKVWECTFDLGELMATQDKYLGAFKRGTVLDLGCGSGILGILAVKLGAAKVVFQDYNQGVLEKVTMKNYAFNCLGPENSTEDQEGSSQVDVQFYCGDWSSFETKVEEQYDVILTSETIYNVDNYDKLISLFKNKLKPDGVVLLAAKTYYFGVGGGLRLFEKAMQADGALSYRTAWECDSGVKREILEIKRKT